MKTIRSRASATHFLNDSAPKSCRCSSGSLPPGTAIDIGCGTGKLAGRMAARGWRVVDATCPHVIRIQKLIDRHVARGESIIIIGDGMSDLPVERLGCSQIRFAPGEILGEFQGKLAFPAPHAAGYEDDFL